MAASYWRQVSAVLFASADLDPPHAEGPTAGRRLEARGGPTCVRGHPSRRDPPDRPQDEGRAWLRQRQTLSSTAIGPTGGQLRTSAPSWEPWRDSRCRPSPVPVPAPRTASPTR